MADKKVAYITGITGQDGAYLAELLLEKGYEVHGVKRRSSSFNTPRIDHLQIDNHRPGNLHLHYGDMTDSTTLIRQIADCELPRSLQYVRHQRHPVQPRKPDQG